MQWLAPQQEALNAMARLRRFILLWRRQFGKTTTLSGAALMTMMDHVGMLVTYASASLLLGRELIEREASILHKTYAELQRRAEESKLQLRIHDRADSSKSDPLLKPNVLPRIEDFTEMFEKSRLELRLYHTKTLASRTQVIAANPATARGWTGIVMIDEIGWIPAFREVWDAMIWIASREESFRVLMATTPPDDEAHFSYELLLPPPGTEFAINPAGNWFRSTAGVMVHRCDAWDADAAGVKMLDDETGKPLTPDEHRALSVDKRSWDINMGLKFLPGGTSALSRLVLDFAQSAGKDKCRALDLDLTDSNWRTSFREILSWLKLALGSGKIGIGFDVATTEKEKSNPSAVGVVEKNGDEFIARLIVRWKTNDDKISDEIIMGVTDAVNGRKEGGKAQGLGVDATNETFYATSLRRKLSGKVMVRLAKGSETVNYQGEDITRKAYQGKILVHALQSSKFLLPGDKWITDDFLLVKDDRGSFNNETDKFGNHGDTFDGCKQALDILVRRGGSTFAQPSAVGSFQGGST